MYNSHLEQTVLIMEYSSYEMPAVAVVDVVVMDIPVLVVRVVQQ